MALQRLRGQGLALWRFRFGGQVWAKECLDGAGRAYMFEAIHLRDGSSHLNYAIYHDRYQRTAEGWRFAERVYQVRYIDTTPLTGSAPHAAGSQRP